MIAPMIRYTLPLAAALVVAGAQAAGDKIKLGAFGPGKAAGPLLSKTELRDCLERMGRVQGGNRKLAEDRDAIDRGKADLQRQGDELKAQRETLDRGNAEAVAAFNERAIELDKARAALLQRVESFNAGVGALEGERQQFAQRCENRRFDQEDETAVRAEMAKGS